MGLLDRWLGGAAKEPRRISIEPDGRTFEARAGESILQSALAAGIPFPHSCKVGTCTSCKCRLLEGRIREVRDFSYVLSGEEIRAGVILACQSVPKSDLRVQVAHLRSGLNVPTRTIPGRVSATAALAPDVVELRIALDEPIRYRAGQFAELDFDGLDRPRSYSFAAAPGEDGSREVVFHVRLFPGGRVSEWLRATDRRGEPVRLTGPFGTFWLREGREPILAIAGGSGMAPIRAILEAAAREGVARDVVYLYGARTRDHLYGRDELERLAASWTGSFRFVPVLSEEPAASEWSGARGFVTEALGTDLVDPRACHAYLCGPPAMIDAAVARLAELGTPADVIHADRFLDARHLAAPNAA